MNELITAIYGTDEADLKAAVLRFDAEELKAAAKSLGIEYSASGKPVDDSKRFDNALAIKATQADEIMADDDEAELVPDVEAKPSIVLAEPATAKKPEAKKPPQDVDEIKVVEAEIVRLKSELNNAVNKLNRLLDERESGPSMSQNDLLNVRRKRMKIAEEIEKAKA